MSCSSDAAENDLGLGGGWNISVHSPFILVTQRYRTAHPRLSGLTWQCFILVSLWVDRVTRLLHVMSELWQNWGWRIQMDSLEHVFGVLVLAVDWSHFCHVTSFCPPFSHHLLMSGLLPGEGRIRSCQACGGLEITQWQCCRLLHSVSQSKVPGPALRRGGKANPPPAGKNPQGHWGGTSEVGGIVAGFIGNNHLSTLARTAFALNFGARK